MFCVAGKRLARNRGCAVNRRERRMRPRQPAAERPHARRLASAVLSAGVAAVLPGVGALAADAYIPIVMPITGFMSVEGGSQRNGAVMAMEKAPAGVKAEFPVFDT